MSSKSYGLWIDNLIESELEKPEKITYGTMLVVCIQYASLGPFYHITKYVKNS